MANQSLLEGIFEEGFAAFDVETTGLDPQLDEIIEIGMVRLQSGKIVERFQSLYRPSKPIPPNITKLTGIRDVDCADQPPFSQGLGDVLNFLGGRWIVAHNADFDFGFLSNAIQRFLPHSGGVSASRLIDTLSLGRLLMPFLPNHRLETLMEAFGLPFVSSHRALADAEAAAGIFHRMLPLACELGDDTFRTLNRIFDGASDGLRLFFQRLESLKGKTDRSGQSAVFNAPSNVRCAGKKTPAARPEAVQRLPLEDVAAFFSESGGLSQQMAHYEPRPSQAQFANLVARALNEDAFLVVEAGTGIGKTLAYLAPALFWLKKNPGQKVVVSTHTKTLQDQLFYKDMPLLENGVPDPFCAVLLKGRSNYLCLSRWFGLVEHLNERLDAEQRRKLLPLAHWLSLTRTGDIEENSGFARESNEDVWIQLHSDLRHCKSRDCPFEDRCFFQNVRKAARSADLLVVNHSLLFSTLNGRPSALGEYETLIVDEAHQMEKAASAYLGIRMNEKTFHDAVHWMYHAKPEEAGLLVSLASVVKSGRIPKNVRITAGRMLRSLKSLILEIDRAAAALFSRIDSHFFQPEKGRPERPKARIREGDELTRAASAEITRLREILVQAGREWASFAEFLVLHAKDGFTDHPDPARDIESVLERLDGLIHDLDQFIQPDFENRAVWCEFSEWKTKRDVSLCSVPIDIGSLLAQRLYPGLRRGIMTSATLAVGESFDHVLNRWGLSRVEPERVVTRLLGSPFHYRDQVLFLIPTFLSNPKEEPFTEQLSALLGRILAAHSRGTLVLFTSHRALKSVYQSVHFMLEEKGVRILGQGIDGSRTAVLRMFQQNVKSVLFGTSSFWEGVDVPGEALELLVITRIPFDVPTEPLFQARMERVQQKTGNAFFHYAVPEALVRFRQGFGRLIRSCSDRGVVLLTDMRAVQTAYGPLFLKALPVESERCENEAALLARLENWFSS